MTPRTASIPVFSELNTGRSEAAAGGAPAAEMGAADLWITRATDVYSADWDRQEDAMFPVRPISLLTSTLHLPKTQSSSPSSPPLGIRRRRNTYISSYAHTFPT